MSGSTFTWSLSKLKLEDWDFHRDKLSDDEVESCHWYEFCREDQKLRQAVGASRRRYTDYREKFGRDDPARNAADALYRPTLPLACRLHPDWPDLSFRGVKWPKKNTSSEPSMFYGVIPRSLAELVDAYFGRVTAPGDRPLKDWPQSPAGGLWHESEQDDLVAFEIPWRWPDSILIDGFKRWLAENRPQGKPGDWRPVVDQEKKPTGASARKRQYLADLKALGAYRLLHCYKGDRQRAKGHYDALEVLGRDFQHDSAWTDAIKRVERQIERVCGLNEAFIHGEQFVGRSLMDIIAAGLASTQNTLEAK